MSLCESFIPQFTHAIRAKRVLKIILLLVFVLPLSSKLIFFASLFLSSSTWQLFSECLGFHRDPSSTIVLYDQQPPLLMAPSLSLDGSTPAFPVALTSLPPPSPPTLVRSSSESLLPFASYGFFMLPPPPLTIVFSQPPLPYFTWVPTPSPMGPTLLLILSSIPHAPPMTVQLLPCMLLAQCCHKLIHYKV